MMAALVICWGPMITWNILRYFEGDFQLRKKSHFNEFLVKMNASLCAILNTMKSLFPWSNPILNACLYAFRVRRFRQDVKNILYKQHMERKFGSKFSKLKAYN